MSLSSYDLSDHRNLSDKAIYAGEKLGVIIGRRSNGETNSEKLSLDANLLVEIIVKSDPKTQILKISSEAPVIVNKCESY